MSDHLTLLECNPVSKTKTYGNKCVGMTVHLFPADQ